MGAMTRHLFAFCLTFLATCDLFASDSDRLRESLAEIRAIRLRMQKRTASLLVLSKQWDIQQTQAEPNVRVVKPAAVIRQADLTASGTLLVAQLGDEFPIVRQQGDWFQIRLPDGREGWIQENAVQWLTAAVQAPQRVSQTVLVSQSDARLIAHELFQHIEAQRDTANKLVADFENYYESLALEKERDVQSLHEDVSREYEKIKASHVYASHFYQKLPPVQDTPVTGFGQRPIGIEGVLSARLGRSAFNSSVEESEIASNLSFAGSMLLNQRSRITAHINHSNEVIQSPYTTSDLKLGYAHQSRGGTQLRIFGSYRGYSDKKFDRNSFKDLGGGLNLEHSFGANTRLFGDFQANSKSYEQEGSNDYKGGQFDARLQLDGGRTEWNLGVRGRIQSSNVSFLDYSRIMPHLRFVQRTESGSFGVNAEVEKFTYDAAAESNNYNRERLDLIWSGQGSQYQLSVIAKQFPNNNGFDDLRFLTRGQWSETSGGSYGRTALSALYVHHPRGGDFLSNYLDLRADRNQSGPTGYFDLSFFSRVWQNTDRDHSIDLYSRFGWNIFRIQIGPVLGAHLLLNTKDLKVKRAGNNFRVGLDARGNFLVNKTTIYGSLRYETSFVFSSEISIDSGTGLVTEGEVRTRKPTTLQFSAGLQTSIYRNLDLQIDVRHYNIELDVSQNISINPVENRSSLRFLAGVVYRFSR